MKKIVLCSLAIIVSAICFSLFLQPQVELDAPTSAIARFKHNESDIESELSTEHTKQIVGIFQGKKLRKDSPSCGFTEDVSVKIDDKTFCITCDTCRIVYLLEDDRYFYLSDTENSFLREILTYYGFELPCI